MTAVLDHVAAEVIGLIHRTALPLSNEKDAQVRLDEVLTAAGMKPAREVRLSPQDIPDFLLPCGLAIEVKLRGASKRRVFAQLQRYAAHDKVAGILLATNLPMGVPPQIEGKPAWYASLGRGWL